MFMRIWHILFILNMFSNTVRAYKCMQFVLLGKNVLVLFIVFLLVCIVLVYCIVLEVLECFDLFSFYSGGSAETGPNVKQDKTRLCTHQSRSDSDLGGTYRILFFPFKSRKGKAVCFSPLQCFSLEAEAGSKKNIGRPLIRTGGVVRKEN